MSSSSSSQGCSISNSAPAWSPDGSKLAFTRVYYSNGKIELWVMNADGSNQRRLLPTLREDHHPTWSPDGSRIAFGRLGEDRLYHIYVINADGTDLTRLSAGGEPAWSPKGDKIAFAMRVNGVPQIHLMNPNGTGLQRLTYTNAGEDFGPAWSPDGSKLAFVRHGEEPDIPSIYVMNADGSGVRKLTNDRDEWYPSWSSDGSKIVYRSDFPGVNPLMLYVIDMDGSDKRRLLPTSFAGDTPDWSRDGKIAFGGDPGPVYTLGGEDVYSVDPDGSNLRNLTQTNGRLVGALKPVSFATAPTPARAGKRLTARLTVADEKGAPLAFDYPHCRASVGGRRLGVVDLGFVEDHVRCVWFVPRSAKGKVVRGTIAVESCDSKLDWSFKRRVRA